MLIRLAICLTNRRRQKNLARNLEKEDIVLECYDADRAPWQKIIRSCSDIIVLSESLVPSPIEDGLAMLNELPEGPTSVILYDGGSVDSQAKIVAAGADLALDVQVSARSLAEAITTVVEARKIYSEKTFQAPPQGRPPTLGDFISENRNMYLFMKEVSQVAARNVPLLILGETGVGKEHLARAIHSASPRSGGPFVTINAAAIPEQLLESELFGHAQGAYTGAARSRRGAFELAHHGTIFLDEIGDLPLPLQGKLLRTLQDYEVRPLGSETSIWVDVRVIAATNRDLDDDIQQGTFRKDLFFRLSVIPLTIPPLRDRREDIPAIVTHILEARRQRFGYGPETVSEEALQALISYDWPGNTRELINVLERAIILCDEEENEISAHYLPQAFSTETAAPVSGSGGGMRDDWQGKTLPEVLKTVSESVERDYLKAILRQTGGRIGRAAALAGITSRSLYSKMKEYGFTKADFKGLEADSG
ncbi:MAG: sigma 54-interacting transcriptional regulator [Lentisphaeria bacterium]|nr:sigma 54-interacting transcriptional regulator [Lentisphaeria bacterium]